MFIESNNIANGGNTEELAIDIQFGVQQGYYECLSSNRVRLTAITYIYKTNALPALQSNGAIATHTYYLTFSKDFRKCSGELSFLFFTTGSNPFRKGNVPTYVSSKANVTCELLDGRDYKWPSG
ncbi:unnamed protein product [Rotaria sordida]|uniref:Uncharacterized protein n=1 Tax=Rotaria sordida TaxID=392033 RepID=A0A815VA59_9BILA|nr:unnamed protein product [Rotaria sordida]CAF4167421.1 unnamed protein product [Rotaria sordida]CAF4226647.1 unnamed protein product [Rotaria sordida]